MDATRGEVAVDTAEGKGNGPPKALDQLFTRQASGMVRELGMVAAISISLAAVAVANTFINFNAGLTDFSKADMYLPLLVAAGIWIIAMFAYRQLLDAIPRAGGEYVFLSRIVSPAVGSIAGLGIAMVFTYVLAANAHFAAQFVPFMLVAIGQAFHSQSIANAGNHLTGDGAIVILSILVMLLVALSMLFSVKRVTQIILVLILIQVVAFLALIAVLAAHSKSQFIAAFGSYSGHHGAYAAMIAAGSSHGIAYGTSIAALVAIIPFMVLNYNGVLYSYYVGGELRRPGRTYLYASMISIGVLVVLWGSVWALLRARVGLPFMQAQANLGAFYPADYAKITGLSSTAGGLGYGLALSKDPITALLFGTAVPFAEIAVNLAFVTVTTRVLFAQAFDRLLPVRMAAVSPRTNGPTVAVVVVLVGGIIFSVLNGFINLGSIVAQESLFFALVLLAGGVAATLLPWRRPDLVKVGAMTEEQRRRWRLKVTLFGGLTTALALFTVVEIIVHSNVYGKFSFPSVATLVVVLGAGPVTYFFVRQKRRRDESLDLDMAMRTLPPE
jgi:APA family basic amino acid/polyamine antiporter